MGGILGSGYGVIEVKQAIEEGWYEGSRIICAPYYLGTTGSHGDTSQAFSRNTGLAAYMVANMPNVGNGPEFFREQVRLQVKGGADFIKIMATGGFATPNDSPVQQQLSDDELKAILDTSKELGMTVTAHAYTPELIQKPVSYTHLDVYKRQAPYRTPHTISGNPCPSRRSRSAGCWLSRENSDRRYP